MRLKYQYQWYKQENGNYTIMQVPIFKTHTKDGGKLAVTLDNLLKIVDTFEADRKNGWYPRIHLGHHTGQDNQIGVGFGDNFILNKETVFADLVEITKNIFDKIYNNIAYPYLSVEYAPNENRITSIALLESQPPFFMDLPILAVSRNENKRGKLTAVYQRQRQTILYQKGEKMPEPIEEPKVEPKVPEAEPKKDEYQDEDKQDVKAMVKEMHDMLSDVHAWLEMEHRKTEKELVDKNQEDENKPEPSSMAKPDSVAFQKAVDSAVEKYMAANAKQDSIVGRLNKVCAKAQVDPQTHLNKVQQYSRMSEKESYVDALEQMYSEKLGKHDATGYTQKYSRGNMQTVVDPLKAKARETYQRMVSNGADGRKFQKAWDTEERFVQYALKDPTILEGL